MYLYLVFQSAVTIKCAFVIGFFILMKTDRKLVTMQTKQTTCKIIPILLL